jgi:hypothetical protein
MGFMKRPKAPKPTAQQLAAERRTAAALDEETADVERRLKAAARGKLGAKSLLPTSQQASGTGAASRIRMGLGSRGSAGSATNGIMRFRNLPNGDQR